MSTAWTASVWGNAKTALLAQHGKLKEGEDECMICRGDVAASVSLLPCTHKMCFACVENMRAKNIFKADKGVKCPFCRTFVERYVALDSASEDLKVILAEANRAAGIAASARSGAVLSASTSAVAPPVTPPIHEDGSCGWVCEECNNVNFYYRDTCNRCNKSNPRAKASTKGRDLLKCSKEEIVEFLREKMHPNLNRAFLEAGLPYANGKLTGGTPEMINTALKNRGEERLLKVISVLADPDVILESSSHIFANYTIQDIIEAAHRLRLSINAKNQCVLENFRRTHDGRDPYAAILYAVLPHAQTIATHTSATYVVQKLLESCRPAELVDLVTAVWADHAGMRLISDPKGQFVMLKAVNQLAAKCVDETRSKAAALANKLCQDFASDTQALKAIWYSPIGSQIVAEAVAIGLPGKGAFQLGRWVAGGAAALSRSHGGLLMLTALLRQQPVDVSCESTFRDFVCVAVMKMHGRFVDMLLAQDDRSRAAVRLCFQRLAEDQEIAWIDEMLKDITKRASELLGNEEALEVLCTGLSLNVLPKDFVMEHLRMLGDEIGPDAMEEIKEEVLHRISQNGRLPPPKYDQPSRIQPDDPTAADELAEPAAPNIQQPSSSYDLPSNGISYVEPNNFGDQYARHPSPAIASSSTVTSLPPSAPRPPMANQEMMKVLFGRSAPTLSAASRPFFPQGVQSPGGMYPPGTGGLGIPGVRPPGGPPQGYSAPMMQPGMGHPSSQYMPTGYAPYQASIPSNITRSAYNPLAPMGSSGGAPPEGPAPQMQSQGPNGIGHESSYSPYGHNPSYPGAPSFPPHMASGHVVQREGYPPYPPYLQGSLPPGQLHMPGPGPIQMPPSTRSMQAAAPQFPQSFVSNMVSNLSVQNATLRYGQYSAQDPAREASARPLAEPVPAAGAAPRLPMGAAAQPVPPTGRGPQPPARPGPGVGWSCKRCTYEHAGPEANFLACAVCGAEKGFL